MAAISIEDDADVARHRPLPLAACTLLGTVKMSCTSRPH
jgi:hypothetical protein